MKKFEKGDLIRIDIGENDGDLGESTSFYDYGIIFNVFEDVIYSRCGDHEETIVEMCEIYWLTYIPGVEEITIERCEHLELVNRAKKEKK
ncbi:MAG: hypothetical protein Q8P81_02255 [Nanoarchaeota archaeon]|nr:hypothetical protein [Nanoarchaeota archaeon]